MRILSLLILPLFAHEIAIGSLFHNTAPRIKEWVDYHHAIGVDHFYLYNDNSTDDWQRVLAPYIESGLVEVFHWPASKPCWLKEQITAFQDALTRAKNANTTWIALIDQDEFIVPMRHSNLKTCLAQHFSHASAIYVNWLCFGTSHKTIPPYKPILPHLTRCSRPNRAINKTAKTIIRSKDADIACLWSAHFCPLLRGIYVDGSAGATVKATLDVRSDGKRHTKYLRINHYAHGDEHYFHNVRCKRPNHFAQRNGEDINQKHYKQFNETSDFRVLKINKKN